MCIVGCIRPLAHVVGFGPGGRMGDFSTFFQSSVSAYRPQNEYQHHCLSNEVIVIILTSARLFVWWVVFGWRAPMAPSATYTKRTLTWCPDELLFVALCPTYGFTVHAQQLLFPFGPRRASEWFSSNNHPLLPCWLHGTSLLDVLWPGLAGMIAAWIQWIEHYTQTDLK